MRRQLIFIFSERPIKNEVLVIFKKSHEIYLKEKKFFSKGKSFNFFFVLNIDCICFLFCIHVYRTLSELDLTVLVVQKMLLS